MSNKTPVFYLIGNVWRVLTAFLKVIMQKGRIY